MPRNRQRPSLLRTTARAAVVSSAVTASSQATSSRMAARSAPDQPQVAAAPSVQPAAAPPADWVAQLAQLAQLRDSGALTEAEFQQAKASLLPPG